MSDIDFKQVYSTSVDEIGYDDDRQELHVRWANSGRISVYSGVPENFAREIMNAPSIGAAVRGLRGTYGHRYV